jgi:hypothetical protein
VLWCGVNFFYIKNIYKKIVNDLKVLGLSTKLYLKKLNLSATSNLEVIFIILIIISNLHDPSLSEFSYNIKPGALDMGLAAKSCYKSVIIKKKKN